MKTVVALLIGAFLLQGGAVILVWNSQKKHTWNDFKGVPEAGSPLAVLSYITFSMSHKINKDTLYFECVSTFNCNRSWYRKEEATPALLQHEDVHFNINEAFCRKLKRLISAGSFTKRNFKEKIGQAAQMIFKETEKYQRQYETETDYSRNTAKQQEWNKRVAAELDQLKNYSKPIVKIAFTN